LFGFTKKPAGTLRRVFCFEGREAPRIVFLWISSTSRSEFRPEKPRPTPLLGDWKNNSKPGDQGPREPVSAFNIGPNGFRATGEKSFFENRVWAELRVGRKLIAAFQLKRIQAFIPVGEIVPICNLR
jgi:hypothetical protein